jgi:copper chaperone CopZ
MPRLTLAVRGMHCAHCVATVTRALEAVPGVAHAAVFLDAGEVEVDVAAGVAPETLAAAVTASGYPATVSS